MVDGGEYFANLKRSWGGAEVHNRAGYPHMETPSFLSSWLSEAPDFLTVFLFYFKLSAAQDKGIVFDSYYPISTENESRTSPNSKVNIYLTATS